MDENAHGNDSTKIIISPPVRPVKKKLLKTLSKVLSDIEPVREAHLPLVLEIGSNLPPALVLFVVVDPPSKIPVVVDTINTRFKFPLPKGELLQIRPITKDFKLLPTIRDTKCVVGWRD